MAEVFRSKGVQFARRMIEMTIAEIEAKAQASDLKSKVLVDLREAVMHLRRNIDKPRAKPFSRRMDRDLVQSIMLAVIARPKASRKEIGDAFNVQSGRVTEVIQGRFDHLLSDELRETFGQARKNMDELQLNFRNVRSAA